MGVKGKTYCECCEMETSYHFDKRTVSDMFRDKVYNIEVTSAVCDECGNYLTLPELKKLNSAEIDRQIRAMFKLVTVEDISKLMKIYNIGKAPLSLALGFGEITITRYLDGQMPSQEYSDVIKNALSSPGYMVRLLNKNKNKISDAAYHKALMSAKRLSELFDLSGKMISAIAYLFYKIGDISSTQLHHLLYFTECINFALYGTALFVEDCKAGEHGPVYSDVYDLFSGFIYNITDDDRFVIFDYAKDLLSDDDKTVLQLVVDTFGLYSAQILEKISEKDRPWKDSYTLLKSGTSDDGVISKKTMMLYYKELDGEYDLSDIEGINSFIYDRIK